MNERARGCLIVCEGIDGSGKTTVSRALVDALIAKGVATHWTCEPTRTWLGEAVRRGVADDLDPFAVASLFMADHAEHVRQVKAHLTRGEVVVSDRWSDSTHAYQAAALEGRVHDPITWLTQAGAPANHVPEIVLYFDLPVASALARLESRGAPRERFENRAVLERVAANYGRLAKERAYLVIDADRDLESVVADAVATVQRALREHGIL